jgi:hypothetical protein
MPITNTAIDDAISRTVAIAGLAGIALIHVLQLPGAFSETRYLGLLFIGAIVAAVALAAILTHASDRGIWTATAALGALILLGYVLSRTTGLPDATDDVGEWDEPLGLASMVAESLVVCVSGAVLATGQQAAESVDADPAGSRGLEPATVAVRGGASSAQRRAAATLGLVAGQGDDAPPHLLGVLEAAELPPTTSNGVTRTGAER